MATTTALLFPWKDTYKVNIEVVDSQHRVLVDLINELHQAMMAGTGKEHLSKILANLIAYTKAHFKAEEGLMLTNQYPDFTNHKAEHDRFTKTIMNYQSKFQNNDFGLTVQVMGFLKEWLLKHIMGVDKKYVPHLSANGVR
jgi:hemerythrin